MATQTKKTTTQNKKMATKSSFVNGVETGEELIQQTAGILVGVTGILVGVTKVFVNTTVVAPLRYVATVAQASIPVKLSGKRRKPFVYTPRRKRVK